MSLATLRMALFYGCHYVHQVLVRGQNDISSYNNLRRAQNHFRAGMDCPQVVHKTIYGVNGNTTFVGSAAYVDLLTDFANGWKNETQRAASSQDRQGVLEPLECCSQTFHWTNKVLSLALVTWRPTLGSSGVFGT
jgi:hypothetical protein